MSFLSLVKVLFPLRNTICYCVVILIFLIPVDLFATDISRETPVVRAVRKVSPAVVNISSQEDVRTRVSPFSIFGRNSFTDHFFNDFFDPGFEQRFKKTSLGSGVIIDGKGGYIITNAHVIARAGKITVICNDEREFEAQIVGADWDSDLAVLRIESDKPLPSIKMAGPSEGFRDLMIGETVIAIGNPFGFSHTVTTGVISALNRHVRTENMVYKDFIQTDASINPGNSGGPLLNIHGQLIGINTAVYAKAQGIGFAIPIYKAQKIVSDLIRFGEVVPAWIGITVQEIDHNLSRYLKVPCNNNKKCPGVLVKDVNKNSPAENAGIKNGDILFSIDGENLFTLRDYQFAMRNYANGDSLRIKLWRNKKAIVLMVKAKMFPESLAFDLAKSLLGITIEDISLNNRLKYRISEKEGVFIVNLKRNYYLWQIGVRPGDIIRRIDEITIKDTTDFKKAIIKYRHKPSLVILLQRGDQLYNITVKL